MHGCNTTGTREWHGPQVRVLNSYLAPDNDHHAPQTSTRRAEPQSMSDHRHRAWRRPPRAGQPSARPRLNVLPLADCSAPTSHGCSCSSIVAPPNVVSLQSEHVEHEFVLGTRCLQGLSVWFRLCKPQFHSVDRLSAPRCVTVVQKSAPNATNVTVKGSYGGPKTVHDVCYVPLIRPGQGSHRGGRGWAPK